MFTLLTLTLATFFVWSSIRYPAERYVRAYFDASRVVHPVVVAALPLVVLWPEWVSALAVAGLVGLLVAATDRYLATDAIQPISIPNRRRRGVLPPLP